jgi:hypothetical protein
MSRCEWGVEHPIFTIINNHLQIEISPIQVQSAVIRVILRHPTLFLPFGISRHLISFNITGETKLCIQFPEIGDQSC